MPTVDDAHRHTHTPFVAFSPLFVSQSLSKRIVLAAFEEVLLSNQQISLNDSISHTHIHTQSLVSCKTLPDDTRPDDANDAAADDDS